MSLRAAFETKTPDLQSSERTKNLKAKTIYGHMLSLVRYGRWNKLEPAFLDCQHQDLRLIPLPYVVARVQIIQAP